jgi:hypothetical protein
MTTYLESLLSENATAGPGAHKMDLCNCALELQEAFDSDKEYKLGSFFGVTESILRNMGREDLIIDSQSPPPPPPASTAKCPKKMEQNEEAKDKKKQACSYRAIGGRFKNENVQAPACAQENFASIRHHQSQVSIDVMAYI